MKHTLAILILICVAISTPAQMPYNFTTKQNSYTPLNNAISLNKGEIWDEDAFTIPMDFPFTLGRRTVDTIYLKFDGIISADTSVTTLDGIVFIDADLQDRGAMDTTQSLSPVSYKTEGAVGNRICKIEVANAGFYDERDQFGTMDDYVNVQVWLYEQDSKLELHYGPSKISNPTKYFLNGAGPLVGFAKEFSYLESSGLVYTLAGDPDSPTLDSFSMSIAGYLLNDYPEDGTVYSFNNKTLSVSKEAITQQVLVYPTYVQNALHVDFGQETNAIYRVVSTTGARVDIYGEMNGRHSAIDVSSLSSGLYILQVNVGGVYNAYRFVKR